MKCNICGNKIKDGSLQCNVCGATVTQNDLQYVHTVPIHQQYNNYNNLNENIQYNNQVQQPYNAQYNQSPIYAPVVDPNKKSGMDIASMIFGIFELYYLFCLISIINTGLNEFISENFVTAEQLELLENPTVAALCMTYPLLFFSIPGLILGIVGRKRKQNGMNIFGIISNVVSFIIGIGITYYIANNI